MSHAWKTQAYTRRYGGKGGAGVGCGLAVGFMGLPSGERETIIIGNSTPGFQSALAAREHPDTGGA